MRVCLSLKPTFKDFLGEVLWLFENFLVTFVLLLPCHVLIYPLLSEVIWLTSSCFFRKGLSQFDDSNLVGFFHLNTLWLLTHNTGFTTCLLRYPILLDASSKLFEAELTLKLSVKGLLCSVPDCRLFPWLVGCFLLLRRIGSCQTTNLLLDVPASRVLLLHLCVLIPLNVCRGSMGLLSGYQLFIASSS